MSDTILMQIIINGSGVDSGEVDYLIKHANLENFYKTDNPESLLVKHGDILFMLARLKRKATEYYEQAEKSAQLDYIR